MRLLHVVKSSIYKKYFVDLLTMEVNIKTLLPTLCNHINPFDVSYALGPTKFGECLIAFHDSKLCYVKFNNKDASKALRSDFPRAILKQDEQLSRYLPSIFEGSVELDLLLVGTDFQVEVWKELMKVPFGRTASYEDIAIAIGRPKSVRAVANAVGKNKLTCVVPCHRIIAKNGGLGGFAGGLELKTRLLEHEGER